MVRWTGLQAHPEKRGRRSAAEEVLPEDLWSIADHPQDWVRRIQGTKSRYNQAIGLAEALLREAVAPDFDAGIMCVLDLLLMGVLN